MAFTLRDWTVVYSPFACEGLAHLGPNGRKKILEGVDRFFGCQNPLGKAQAFGGNLAGLMFCRIEDFSVVFDLLTGRIAVLAVEFDPDFERMQARYQMQSPLGAWLPEERKERTAELVSSNVT